MERKFYIVTSGVVAGPFTGEEAYDYAFSLGDAPSIMMDADTIVYSIKPGSDGLVQKLDTRNNEILARIRSGALSL